MSRCQPALVLAILLAAPLPAAAQALGAANSSLPNPASPYLPGPANPYLPSRSGAGAAPQPGSAAAPNPAHPGQPGPTSAYGSNPANYATTPESAKRTLTPQQRASQRQSGLTQTQAKTLLEDKGYQRIVKVEADPSSLWVWQADVIKDGRPTRVGIDYRGNVLDLSSTQARPCREPGVRLGATGGLAVGSRLSQADSCAGR
jgi:hypothetical protein